MSGRSKFDLSPHGTKARARWHYRRGEKPLRKYCPACADANALAEAVARDKRKKEFNLER